MSNFILAKTPLRITFFGGGTDYFDYFKLNGGKTIGVSVNYYSYIIIKKLSPIDKYKFRITYSKKELRYNVNEISHPAFREALKYTKLSNEPLEIQYFSDLPSFSGMGSSSAFVISLLNALYFYKGIKLTKNEIAKKAIYFERYLLKEQGGFQDQLTCAHGGICYFNYSKDKIFKSKIKQKKKIEKFISKNFLLLYSNISRDGTKVAKKQKKINKTKMFKNFPIYVDKSIELMSKNKINELGKLFHLSWKDKKKLPYTSNNRLDKIYKLALNSGALGGKLLGVGGGGFFLFLVPFNKHAKFKKKMKKFLTTSLTVDNDGSMVKRFKV